MPEPEIKTSFTKTTTKKIENKYFNATVFNIWDEKSSESNISISISNMPKYLRSCGYPAYYAKYETMNIGGRESFLKFRELINSIEV